MKYKSIKSIFWVLKLQYRAAAAGFIWNIVFNIYDGVISLANTYIAAQLIASVTEVALQGASTAETYKWIVILFAIEIVDQVLRVINGLVDRRSEQKLEVISSELFFNKIYQLSQEQFEDQDFTTKVARASDGMNQFGRVSREINWLMSSLIRFVGALLAIIFVSPIIGLLMIVIIVPVAYMRMKQNKLNEKVYKEMEPTDRVAWRSRWLLMDPTQMPEVRIVNGFKGLVHSWRVNTKKSQDAFFESNKRLVKYDFIVDTLQPTISFFATVYFFRLLVSGTLAFDKFIFLRGILDQASGAALSVAASLDSLHDLSINLDNFNQVNNTQPTIKNGKVKVETPLKIEFSNVSFYYPNAKEPSLQDVSFVIHPGSKLALVGENGAGKTTLIKLLLRQYLPTSGSITVNGTDIKDVEQESYYDALSVLSQDFLIVYHLTIKENLVLGTSRKISDSELRHATDLAGATEFIEKLRHKYDERLDASMDDGSNLSGGQMQRLGVARALIRKGDVMILDEPTSAIDAKAEYTIFNNIYKAHANKTTLIVSHRFSTVRKADSVIVMENGKIIEYGTHDELLKFGGLYKEMFELQAEGYK